MARLGDKPFYELRVHGVSGTPPAAMLGMKPRLHQPAPDKCGRPPGEDEEIAIFCRPPDEPDLLAFSWSSLTSGSRRTAFYVLLLPYMLANVAGWMMLPLQPDVVTPADTSAGRSWPLRVVALLVRLCGLLVTVMFALSTFLLVTDLGAYQWLVRDRGWPASVVGVGVLVTGGAVLLLFRFTRVQLRSDSAYHTEPFWRKRTDGRKPVWADEADPVGYAWIHCGQRDMWNHPGIIVRLRRLHLAAAWATIALVAGLARPWTEGGGWQAWDRAGAALGIVALVLPVLLLGAVTLGRGVTIPPGVTFAIRWVSCPLALIALVISAARISGIGVPDPGQHLPAIRGSAGWVALVYLLLVLAAGLIGWVARSRRDVCRRAAWNLPGCLLLAAATGTALGAGLALQATRLLGRSGACQRLEASNGGRCDIVVGPTGDWFAIAFTTVLALVGFILLVRFLNAYRTHRTVMVAVRAVLDCSSWLLVVVASLGGFAIVTGLAVVAINGELPSVTSLPLWLEVAITVLLLAPVVVTAFWLTGRVKPLVLRAAAVLGLIVLIVLTVFAAGQGWQHTVLGLSLPPTTFLELTQLVALLVPTTIVVTRFVYAGLQDRDVRRGVGILWDIGAFWPRWFHPFAPPTYSDRAVTHLTALLDGQLADPGHRVLLAPHSQGSIIGAAAILGMDEARVHRVALLTYGCPWSRYYAEFHPALFSATCLAELVERLQLGAPGTAIRWRNLYRNSDPVGGPILAEPPGIPPGQEAALRKVDTDIEDECELVHSSYDLEDAYKCTVSALRDLLLREQQPGGEQQAEHQHEAGGGGQGGQKRCALGGADQ